MREISKEESEVFEALIGGKYTNFALMSTEFDGVETAVIVAVSKEGENVMLEPIAILVKPELFDRLVQPDADMGTEKKTLN